MFDKDKFLKNLDNDRAKLDNEKIEEGLNEIFNGEEGSEGCEEISNLKNSLSDEFINENLDDLIATGVEKENDDEENDEEWTLTPIIKLKVPVDGINEIKLDFSQLNGRNLKKIEKLWEKNRTSRKSVIINAFDTEYCMFIAAHCSGIPYSKLEELNAGDYSKLKLKIQSFLLGS